jgi:putative nucleotidyltransferase with HDIG domain
MRVPGFLKPIGEIYTRAGHQCYLVGGAVRNMVLGQKPKDYDLATDARPEETVQLFRRVIPTGVKHGTVTIIFKGRQFEVTTFRRDQEYSDGRRPDSVEYAESIVDDLARRDFTINAMAIDLESGDFVDVTGGVEDARAGIVRAIGVPEERFREDGLRLMRAVRFAAQLGFDIEDGTFRALKSLAERIAAVSWERIRDELEKLILSDDPGRGLRLMKDSSLLDHVLPELAACVGVPQAGDQDVFDHSILACEGAPAELNLRLAALLHDVGKAPTLEVSDDGSLSFHRHEHVSAELAVEALTRLRFPKAVIGDVSHLITHHMFNYAPEWSDAAVRRFIARVGQDSIDDLLRLRQADTYGKTRRRTPGQQELRRRIDSVLEKDHAFSIGDLAVNGNDLHAHAGIPRGPEMGVVLRFLLETVIDDPSMNERERLLEVARRFYDQRVDVSGNN